MTGSGEFHGMRTLYDRMTNPTPDDLAIQDRAQNLTYIDLNRIVDTLTQALQRFAQLRPDVMNVNTNRDQTGITIRVDLQQTPIVIEP